ncbi:MAG TPA: hypothetical protein VFZ63_13135 [Jiangellaceae bacterium]
MATTSSARWSAALPLAAAGAASVVAGGLVAAFTAAVPSEHGAWVAAYLVLVAGVAQLGLGVGQALLAPRPPSRRLVAAELIAWNGGSAAVIAGTLLDAVLLVDAGGVLLVFALALLVRGVRGSGRRGGWWLQLYRLLATVVLVSVPIGLLLARA